MLQSVLEVVLTILSRTGVIVGAAIHARGYAVEADPLLPLYVLDETELGKDEKHGKKGEPTTSTTFSAFMRGRTMDDLDERKIYAEAVSTGTLGNRLLHNLETSTSPYFGTYQHHVQLNVEPLRSAVYRTLLSHIKDALNQMEAVNAVKAVVGSGGGSKNAESVWHEVQCVSGNTLAVDIENAGETLRCAAEYGMTIARWQGPAVAVGKYAQNRDEPSEDVLLEQAYKACKQAVEAAAMARAEYNQVLAHFPMKATGRGSGYT